MTPHQIGNSSEQIHVNFPSRTDSVRQVEITIEPFQFTANELNCTFSICASRLNSCRTPSGQNDKPPCRQRARLNPNLSVSIYATDLPKPNAAKSRGIRRELPI